MGFRKPFSSVALAGQSDTRGTIGAVQGPKDGGLGSIRHGEVEEHNKALTREMQRLETILSTGLSRDPHVPVGDWRPTPTVADLPPELRDAQPPAPESFRPPPLKLFERLAPGAGARRAAAVAAGDAAFAQAMARWEETKLRQAEELERLAREAEAENRRLEALENRLRAGDRETVQWYAREVLDRSPYPPSLTRDIDLGFRGDSRYLRVRLRIPGPDDLLPKVERYRWNKQQGKISEVRRSPEVRAALYDKVVAELALRTLYEIFTTDDAHAIGWVVLRIKSASTNPRTGRPVIAEALAITVPRATFVELDLGRVDPLACLDGLKSANPTNPLT